MIRMFCTALLLAAFAGPALAGGATTMIFHDKAGHVTGSARTEGSRTTFYDASGRVTGRAERR